MRDAVVHRRRAGVRRPQGRPGAVAGGALRRPGGGDEGARASGSGRSGSTTCGWRSSESGAAPPARHGAGPRAGRRPGRDPLAPLADPRRSRRRRHRRGRVRRAGCRRGQWPVGTSRTGHGDDRSRPPQHPRAGRARAAEHDDRVGPPADVAQDGRRRLGRARRCRSRRVGATTSSPTWWRWAESGTSTWPVGGSTISTSVSAAPIVEASPAAASTTSIEGSAPSTPTTRRAKRSQRVR